MTNFLVRAALVFVIAGFMFGVGTYLGKTLVTADEARTRAAMTSDVEDLVVEQKLMLAHGPTYQEQADEINNAPRINPCSFNQLSPRAQAQRVKDLLGAAPVDLEKIGRQ
jgi:hypothetical protein